MLNCLAGFLAGLVGGGEASETREGLRPARAAAPHKDDSFLALEVVSFDKATYCT